MLHERLQHVWGMSPDAKPRPVKYEEDGVFPKNKGSTVPLLSIDQNALLPVAFPKIWARCACVPVEVVKVSGLK
jgi:hypothetical protein